MQLDYRIIVVVGAVLFFYLRLIIIQRRRVQRDAQASRLPAPHAGKAKPAAKKGAAHKAARSPAVGTDAEMTQRFGLLTDDRGARWVGAAGAVAILAGMLLAWGLVPLPGWQAAWWLPVAVGIVAFSWLFK